MNCTFIDKCKDTKRLRELAIIGDFNNNPSKEKEYQDLYDQNINLCQVGESLQNRTLTCLLMNKYLESKN